MPQQIKRLSSVQFALQIKSSIQLICLLQSLQQIDKLIKVIYAQITVYIDMCVDKWRYLGPLISTFI